jgi:hypothetical protein
LKNDGPGNRKAIEANATARTISIASVQNRFVFTMSTTGLQNGFMTHGR